MIGHKLNPRFTFKQFACGSSNQFAFSSAYATATNPGAAFNPLIIYGTHGLGKSHLLHAIGQQAIANNPSTRVICCSADGFMHEMIEHLRTNQMHSFRENFCSADLLLIDDIQLLAQKERTQQELLFLYDKLTAHQAQVVLAIDRHPLKLTGFDDTLHSRFSGGLMVELTEPDYETKRAILEKLAVWHQIKLPEDVADYLANLQVRSIRELEGGLIRLGTYSSLQNVEISLSLAMKYLQDMTSNVVNRHGRLTHY